MQKGISVFLILAKVRQIDTAIGIIITKHLPYWG